MFLPQFVYGLACLSAGLLTHLQMHFREIFGQEMDKK